MYGIEILPWEQRFCVLLPEQPNRRSCWSYSRRKLTSLCEHVDCQAARSYIQAESSNAGRAEIRRKQHNARIKISHPWDSHNDRHHTDSAPNTRNTPIFSTYSVCALSYAFVVVHVTLWTIQICRERNENKRRELTKVSECYFTLYIILPTLYNTLSALVTSLK